MRTHSSTSGQSKAWARKPLIGLFAALFAAGIGAATAEAAGPQIDVSSAGLWARGRILVAPNAGLAEAEFDRILGAHGAVSSGKVRGLDVHVVELPLHSHGNEEAIARALAKNPHVKFAEVDGVLTPAGTTNDPILSSEWHVTTIGAQSAWDLSIGTGVTVAVLDTGVQSNHPDLWANMVPGWNAYSNNSDSNDVHGHGTAVAGAVAAVGNNGIGVVGVAYGAKIMPIRITDSAASTTFSIMANALTWAADHGAHVANISFSNVYKSSTMQSAALYLRNKGGSTVVAANNNAIDEGSANTTTMITVSATDSYDALASFSSWGPMVDVAAPGVTIRTTLWNSGYGYGSGTSFASPVTAGAVALIKSVNPMLSPVQIESALFSTAKDLGAAGSDTKFGNGRVNVAAAVQSAMSMSAADATPPAVAIASPTGGTVSGLVPVGVNASDNVGVARVELYAGGLLVGTDTASPYSFSWDSRQRADGTYGLLAKAFDAAGNVASSTTVNVSVVNTIAGPDTTPPSVSITNPQNGAKVKGNVSVQAGASDNVGVSTLSVYVDDVLKATGNAATLSYSWNVNKASAGAHTIRAVAKDAAGNTTTTSVSVTK